MPSSKNKGTSKNPAPVIAPPVKDDTGPAKGARFRVNPDEFRSIRTSGHKTIIHSTASYAYDHSITVQKVETKADSRQFLADMAEMSRRSSLTATATRKGK